MNWRHSESAALPPRIREVDKGRLSESSTATAHNAAIGKLLFAGKAWWPLPFTSVHTIKRKAAFSTFGSSLMKMNKLSYTIAEVTEVTGIGRTKIYAAIKDGQLIRRKYGSSTLVLHDDLMNFLQALPVAESGKAA